MAPASSDRGEPDPFPFGWGERSETTHPSTDAERAAAEEALRAGRLEHLLQLVLDGDPLGLETRAMRRLRERGYLIDLDRLYLRGTAKVLDAIRSFAPPVDAWLDARIDEAIREILQADRESERLGHPPESPQEPLYEFVSHRFGIAPASARRMCVQFNGLPEEVRLTFTSIYVDGKSINRWVAEGHGPPDRVRADLRRALAVFTSPLELDDDDDELTPP